MDLRKVIEDLCEGADLSEEDAHAAMEALLDADPTQIAAFLVLLRAKGETASEMAGLARAMQSRAVTVDAGDDVLDIVGTGGDDAGHGEYFHWIVRVGRRGGSEGGETRFAIGVFAVRVGRRAGGARRGHRAGTGEHEALRRGSRRRIYVRAEISSGDGEGLARAQGAQGANGV